MSDPFLQKFDILEEDDLNHKSEQSSSFGKSSRSGGSIAKNVSLRKISKEDNDEDMFLNLPQKLKIMNSQSVIPMQEHDKDKMRHDDFSKAEDK